MRLTIITLLVFIGTSFADLSPQQKLEKRIAATYAAAVKAKKQGDLDTAEKYLNAVVKASPTHGNALFTLKQIRDERELAKNTKSAGSVNGVTIKEIAMDGVQFKEAIEMLSEIIDDSNGENVGAPNFVIVDPEKKLDDKTVSLQLNNVPAKNVFKYCLDAASATAAYGEFVITIRPN